MDHEFVDHTLGPPHLRHLTPVTESFIHVHRHPLLSGPNPSSLPPKEMSVRKSMSGTESASSSAPEPGLQSLPVSICVSRQPGSQSLPVSICISRHPNPQSLLGFHHFQLNARPRDSLQLHMGQFFPCLACLVYLFCDLLCVPSVCLCGHCICFPVFVGCLLLCILRLSCTPSSVFPCLCLPGTLTTCDLICSVFFAYTCSLMNYSVL